MTLLTQPPSGLSRLRGWFRGSVANIIDIARHISDETARAVNEMQQDIQKIHSITMRVTLPTQQFESFLAELTTSWREQLESSLAELKRSWRDKQGSA